MKVLSVVIIAKNEEANIGRSIQSCLRISDDIIVMDTGSTDNTKNIASELGAKVFETEWLGYGITKNKANALAKYDWILSLDADEALSNTLIQSILNTDFQSNNIYQLNRITSIGEKWIKHSGWYPQYLPRIFEKSQIKWDNAHVHEKLIIPKHTKRQTLLGNLLHYSFKDFSDLNQRLSHYSKLKAKQWKQESRRISILKLYFGPLARFMSSYFFKLGFLDGAEGYKIAVEEARMIGKALQYYKKIKHA